MKTPTSAAAARVVNVVRQGKESGVEKDDCSEMKTNLQTTNIHQSQTTKALTIVPKSALILLFNGLIIVAFGVVAYLCKYFLKPAQRGFHCGDLSIRYPFKDTTVPIGSLLLIGNAFTIMAIILGEFFYHRRKFEPLLEVYKLFGQLLYPSFVRFVQFFIASATGFVINVWLVYLIKFNLGQLRPHFLDVCRPNVNYMSCSATQYFENYTCTTNGAEPARKLIDARLSFFSGHTSAAFYYASFFVIYVHARIGRFEYSWTPLFVLLYTIVLTAASLVGISRILDNKHHNLDVMIGAMVGIGVAASVLYCNQHLLCDYGTNTLIRRQSCVYGKDQKKKKKISAGSTQNSNV